MIKILFICHGNICRSPMAEFIFKNMIKKQGIEDKYYVESAATSTEELGNPVYPPARKILAEHGLSCDGKYARQMTSADYENFDYLICMDGRNLQNIRRFVPEDYDNKISLLLDYTDTPRDVADPWYTGEFESVYDDILSGCTAFLKYLEQK